MLSTKKTILSITKVKVKQTKLSTLSKGRQTF